MNSRFFLTGVAAVVLVGLPGQTAALAGTTTDPRARLETTAASRAQLETKAIATSPPSAAATTYARTGTPGPRVITKIVVVRKAIAYSTRRVPDASLAAGTVRVRSRGVPGVRTLTYRKTYTGGELIRSRLLHSGVTRVPVARVIAVGTKIVSAGCDPNYRPCVPVASDVDCAGGSGNGPAYVAGPVTVVGTDVYDLDRDGDGVGCQD